MYKILTVCMSPNDLMEQSYFKYYEKYLNCEVFLYNLVDDVIHIMVSDIIIFIKCMYSFNTINNKSHNVSHVRCHHTIDEVAHQALFIYLFILLK